MGSEMCIRDRARPPMNNSQMPARTGAGLRRRVRALTFGVVGAAVVASAGITAGIAHAQSAQEYAADADSSAASTATGSTTSSSSAAPTTSAAR